MSQFHLFVLLKNRGTKRTLEDLWKCSKKEDMGVQRAGETTEECGSHFLLYCQRRLNIKIVRLSDKNQQSLPCLHHNLSNSCLVALSELPGGIAKLLNVTTSKTKAIGVLGVLTGKSRRMPVLGCCSSSWGCQRKDVLLLMLLRGFSLMFCGCFKKWPASRSMHASFKERP